MALFPLQPGLQPIGQIDVLDTDAASITGGEVMTLTTASRTNTLAEQAAYDVLAGSDGYDVEAIGLGSESRVAAQLASTAAELPLYLADDGSAPDYLTYFGRVVGSSAGLDTAGTVLGPHSAEGSGKVTLWGAAGLYAVTTGSLAATFLSSLGGEGLAPGSAIGFNASGQLAHAGASPVASTGCATFVEFESSPSLVTSSAKLVGGTEALARVKVWFNGGMMADRTVA